jgi:cell division protein FtsW
MAVQLKTDKTLFTTVLATVSFGILILYSTSSVLAQSKHLSQWHYVGRQFLWMLVGILVMMLLKSTQYRKLQHAGVAFAAIGIMLILLLVVYFVDGAHHRWLRIGQIGLQPSELVKPALVVFLAYFVTLRARAINNRYTLVPAALAVGLVLLAVAAADLGTAVVLGVTATVVFFVAGLELRYLMIVGAVGLVGAGVFIVSKPYRLKRVIGYVDPGYERLSRIDTSGKVRRYLQSSLSTQDARYQGEQAKVALGSGGITGLGLGQGIQKLLYLPEAHTDFIYAIAGEELGLIGTVGILMAFFVIFWRGLRATLRAPDDFGRYLALGVTTIVVVQGLMNMTSVLGMMPTKGIPLPMISSGGSSLLSTLASFGILMNISEHVG